MPINKERLSSFELLRLILMFLIIIHHCIVHGLGITALSPNWNTVLLVQPTQMPIALIINSFCICAVNCFILITGFFGIKNPQKKVRSLIFILIFYSLFLTIIPYIISGNYHAAIKYSLFLSHTPYWFVLDYIFLLIFVPLLSPYFEKCSKRSFITLLIGMTIISCYFGFLWGHDSNSNGYTLFQFIYLYCVGRYIGLYKINRSRMWGLGLYIIGSLVTGLTMWMLWGKNLDNYAWRMTNYNNPLIIIAAIGLFFVFKNIKIKNAHINSIAKSSFAIYLVQSAPIIGTILYKYIQKIYLTHDILNKYSIHNNEIFLIIFVLSSIIFLGAILLDRIRIFVFKFFKISE